jgi:uridylate kinase
MHVLELELKVMDATAIALCKDYGIPIHVFNLLHEGNIERVVHGEEIGTIVH